MNKELQDKAWSVLPKKFKEEVKKLYREFAFTREGYYVELFGLHNLTSDAEGEEMLTVPRRKVQEMWQRAYKQESQYSRTQDSSVAREELYYNRGIMSIIDTLFGSKCLPDEVVVAENATASESKPAEPEEKSRNLSQETANCDKHFDNILKDSFRNERRLNIATQIMSSILSNQKMLNNLAHGETTADGVVRCIVNATMMYTDALIAECELTETDTEIIV